MLINCRECGSLISDSASICPYCGVSTPSLLRHHLNERKNNINLAINRQNDKKKSLELFGIKFYTDNTGCTLLNYIGASDEVVVIPNTITKIGYKAFSGCLDLKSVTIPNSVIEIDYNIFEDCFNLEKVILPSRFKSKSSVFWGDTVDSLLKWDKVEKIYT